MDADAWDRRYADSALVWSATPNRFVAEEVAGLPPGRALDLAAGEGRNAIWLARRGWSVTALDFSRVGLAKGRELAGDTPVDWRHGDATTFREPAAYDLVVVAYLQLAAEQRRAAVRAAFDALREGGTLLLVAHDASNLAEGTGGPQDPAVLMTAEDVLSDLDGERFEVVRADRVARTVEPEHGGAPDRVAWDCLVRLVRRG